MTDFADIVSDIYKPTKMKFSWSPPFIVSSGKFNLSKPMQALTKENRKSKKSTIESVRCKVRILN